MKEKDLKHILQIDYNFNENWKPILSLLFNKVDYFSTPSNPFSEEDKVKSGKQIGAIKLDDNKSLAIFEVEVDDSIRIDHNRKGLRDIAARHIDQNITHGALVFFYSKNQTDYRFSFIAKWSEIDLETGEFIKGETKPKRYTYLLGGNESCTTPAKRILELASKKEKGEKISLQDVMDAFAVEPLKKDFFKSYKEHYEKFWRYIANAEFGYRDILLDTSKKDPVKQEKPIRDFVKKLLGRIVFLHFLQKKGWMGCPTNTKKWEGGEKQFMQLLFDNFEDKAHFHSQCLTKLFFNTLNTRRENDVFDINGLNGKLNGSRVPYLNGGLFEADKPKEILNVDFPVKYFEELFEFFAQYNFTIDENSPDDHEVGIDPEMLGHIFENLLEENREKGAFYTPKEIVEYMSKESVIQYLKNHFPEEAKVDEFVRNHQVSEYFTNRDNAIALDQKLDDIKVCDPAIGSGAFPIGILHELFEAKKFIYPYLKTNKEFNPAKVKKDIIQNSIYGVDIEKGAVDIAQLRFWLALVVDETKPQPLPNLDYKIMQGNSLLESFEGIDLSETALFEEPTVTIVNPTLFEEPKADYGFSEENRADIKQLIKDYFKVEDKDEKTKIHKAIDKIVLDHIDKSLEFYENKLLIEIETLQKRLNGKLERLNEKQQAIYLSKSKEVKEIEKSKKHLENKALARAKLLEFEKTDERPYFLWHLYFMDVFEQGGFDIMIGNPPYIQLQKMGKEADILEKVGWETFTRRGDIYSLFYEQGFNMLKERGALVFITSNKWMKGGYGKKTRKLFLSQNTKKIINLGPGIFHSATVDTNVYIGIKEEFKNNVLGIAVANPQELLALNNKDLISMSDINTDAWIVRDKQELWINNQFQEKGVPLRDWDIKINFGIKTGYNDAFILDEFTRKELIEKDNNSEEIIKPLVRGRDIQKFTVDWDNIWIIIAHYGSHTFLKDKYPAIFQHLSDYKENLKKRGQCTNKGGKGQHHWLELDNNPSEKYLNQFATEKVIWKRVGSIMRFAYSDDEMYCLDSTCIATGEKIKYLTAVLNSKACLYQLFKTAPQTGTGDQIISVQALEPLLVPYPDTEIEKKFNLLVDYILFIQRSEKQIFESISDELLSNSFEEVIDYMVYELYFTEHMKEKEIDVLQFVDFQDISQLETFEEKRDVIQKEYYKLKEKDNKIRNRILLAPVHSPNIIKRINESTH